MKMYQENAESSNFQEKHRLSGADLRYLAAELERLAQDLHVGEIPTEVELVVDESYRTGRLAGYEMGTGTSLVLSGLVHSLRRVATHRKAAVRAGGDDEHSLPVYPLVSSALEGGCQS
jgi:hypothetical protein